MADNLDRLADMVEMATGSRPTREELSTYPPPPRYEGHCDCCGGPDFEEPSPAEVAAWQRYVRDKLINKTSAGWTTPISLLHGSGISNLPPSQLPTSGALSFRQPQSFPPRPIAGAPTTRSFRKVRYSQEESLNALLRSTTLNDVGRGLVQPAPQPVKGQRSRLRSKKSTQDASNQSALDSSTPLLPALEDKLSQESDQHLTKSAEDKPHLHPHRTLKTKVKTRPSGPIPPSSDRAETPSLVPQAAHSPPRVFMTSTSRAIFSRMLATDPASRKPLHFDDFAAAMIDAGFVVKRCGRNSGSAVKFKEVREDGGTITFHRPHPDPHIDHNKLRTWGGRLNKNFGWEVESLVER